MGISNFTGHETQDKQRARYYFFGKGDCRELSYIEQQRKRKSWRAIKRHGVEKT